MQILILILFCISFFTLGFVSKELVLYAIRKNRKVDEQLELANKIIDSEKNSKF